MRDLSLFRRYELVFVLSTATIYVLRRLVEEVNRIDGLIGLSASRNGIAAGTYWRDIADYDHTLNNNVPLIAGVCLFLSAWYVFHSLVYPAFESRTSNKQFWFYCVLTVVLLLLCAFVYHFGKLYVRYKHDQAGQIIGLKVFSLYRKSTVLVNAIGLGVWIGAYEVAFQYYQFIVRKLAANLPLWFRVVVYLLVIGSAAVAVIIGTAHTIPHILWQPPMGPTLLLAGFIVQVHFLQHYFYTRLLFSFQQSGHFQSYAPSLGKFLALGISTSVLLHGAFGWGGYTDYDEVANVSRFFSDQNVVLIANSILLFLLAFTLSIVAAYIRRALTKEKAVLQTQVSAKSAELASLQAQINPHFLFNALNSLYATALRENGEKTADGIQKLGDMMRFMLQENNRDRIPLDKEVEYLHNYIEIQRMRIDETHNIEIRVTIQEPNRPIYIAPMMLTPFVENAFKHGISFRHPSWIYITLTLDDTRLYFKVHNTRHARQADTPSHQDPEKDHSGVGLDNVRKRLDLIYPGRHQLDIQQSDQDYFVSLTLVYW